MKIRLLLYIEDDVLNIGMQSTQRFPGSFDIWPDNYIQYFIFDPTKEENETILNDDVKVEFLDGVFEVSYEDEVIAIVEPGNPGINTTINY
jgi:hypothetical protein